MNPAEFARKWKDHTLSERSAYQQHFLDLCTMVGQDPPAQVDPRGESFTFEKGLIKFGGAQGWADVWKKGCFAWEYKKQHADLDKAYKQLLLYREALESPPLMIVSDTRFVIIRTNFTGTLTEAHQIDLFDPGRAGDLGLLKAAFFDPTSLKPGRTAAAITGEAASQIAAIAIRLREKGHDPHRVAQFLDRVVFCMFAEDIELLPKSLFTRLLEGRLREPEKCRASLADLFKAMAGGGGFGVADIRHFNGSLFDDAEALLLDQEELQLLYRAAQMDWREIDPSIFGTLFERGLDPSKRAQLGAHYTSKEDIEAIVEPVILAPLRAEWMAVRAEAEAQLVGIEELTKGRRSRFDKAALPIRNFLVDLASKRILDPSCGSGNFLYTALQRIKDLEKEVIIWAEAHGLGGLIPRVHPRQLFGIEINVYAFELAQLSVWIGYLQWIHKNGFGLVDDPVLQALQGNFLNQDALLDSIPSAKAKIADWPAADFIIGNPPFLGGKLLRRTLGDNYVDELFSAYEGHVKKESDYCCYWFERARQQIESGATQRVGLLATQGIRGKANRNVLERIIETGGVFFAESDRPWVLDGASVHVSMVGFDDGAETRCILDGRPVEAIHADLGAATVVAAARALPQNSDIAFMGITPAGPFDLSVEEALELLHQPNPHGRPNSDVLRPYVNGRDLNQRPSNRWTVDFGELTREEAAQFEGPFRIVEERVRPVRSGNRRPAYREHWWRYAETRPAMRKAMNGLKRYLATSRVAKHRLFSWVPSVALPDSAVIAFAREDDFFFGLLSSRLHTVWAATHGTQLEDRPRYTPTTCFITYPIPRMKESIHSEIATAGQTLNHLRSSWLNPPEWVQEEILRFPARKNGPWANYILSASPPEKSEAQFVTKLAVNPRHTEELQSRTLTELYNLMPAWLRDAHTTLDRAVGQAYGMDPALQDSEVMEILSAMGSTRE